MCWGSQSGRAGSGKKRGEGRHSSVLVALSCSPSRLSHTHWPRTVFWKGREKSKSRKEDTIRAAGGEGSGLVVAVSRRVAVCCSVLQSRVRFEELEDVFGDSRQDATRTRIQISLDRSRGTHMNESWHTCDESRDMVAVATNLRETRGVLLRGRATQIQWVSGRAMLKQQPLLLPHYVAAATVAAATSCCCCCNSCCCNREEQQKLLLRQGLLWLSDRGRSWRWWGGDAEKGDTEDSDDWMTTCGQRLVLWLPHTHTHTHAHTHARTLAALYCSSRVGVVGLGGRVGGWVGIAIPSTLLRISSAKFLQRSSHNDSLAFDTGARTSTSCSMHLLCSKMFCSLRCARAVFLFLSLCLLSCSFCLFPVFLSIWLDLASFSRSLCVSFDFPLLFCISLY